VVSNSTSEPPHSGSWDAWLDGYGSTHTDTLSQQVSIPAGCQATLTFWLHIDTAETTTTTAYDKLIGAIGTTTLVHLLEPQPQHRVQPEDAQRGGVRRADRHDQVHRHGGQPEADVLRHRRHRIDRELVSQSVPALAWHPADVGVMV
jgi:hypothetical protein